MLIFAYFLYELLILTRKAVKKKRYLKHKKKQKPLSCSGAMVSIFTCFCSWVFRGKCLFFLALVMNSHRETIDGETWIQLSSWKYLLSTHSSGAVNVVQVLQILSAPHSQNEIILKCPWGCSIHLFPCVKEQIDQRKPSI